MDRILRADGLDLRLTPYSVLATSISEGFVQFVKATPLRDVISNWGSIQVRESFFIFNTFVTPLENWNFAGVWSWKINEPLEVCRHCVMLEVFFCKTCHKSSDKKSSDQQGLWRR